MALMIEIKLVVTEKYKFENRGKPRIAKLFDFWDCRDFDAENKMIEIWIKSYTSFVYFLIETLMKKMKPLVVMKKEHDYRDIS